MQERIAKVGRGFDLLEKVTSGRMEHSCYICSPSAPKFAKGWRVRLHADDQVVLVGHECGRRHLGVDYQEQVRLFERGERMLAVREEKFAIMRFAGEIRRAAAQTIEDPSLSRILAIKQGLAELHTSARKALDRAAVGALRGVTGLQAFSHQSPRGAARDVLRLIDEIESTDSTDHLEKALREFRRAVDDHNRMLDHYGSGTAGITAANLSRLNEEMPMVEITLRDGQIRLRRITDGLERTFEPPAPLNLASIPFWRG